MALALVAENIPHIGGWFSPVHAQINNRDSYPVLSARNVSTPRNNTVNLFIDALDKNLQYAGSVISACADETVIAIQCTTAPSSAYIGSATCGPNGAVATLTVGPSLYHFSSAVTTQTLGVAVTGTVQETCTLAGTTAATCAATVEATAAGTKTTTSSTATLASTDYYRFDVEITGGAEKIATPVATCAQKGAASGLEAKRVALWAMVAVVGVASVLVV